MVFFEYYYKTNASPGILELCTGWAKIIGVKIRFRVVQMTETILNSALKFCFPGISVYPKSEGFFNGGGVK